MSTATLAPPRIKPRTRLLTAADLADMPDELDGQAVKYELYDGELVVMAPPGYGHAKTQSRLIYHLKCECEFKGQGIACGEVGVILRRNPDRVVGADAAFVLQASLPLNLSREDYLITIPEIVIEVRSKNDWMPELLSKCEEYLEAGTVLVWVLDPRKKSVTEHRRDATPVTYAVGDTLTCDLLPGFAVPIASLFDS